MKKVSILMSVYNETYKEISESIESMLEQTHENFEFLIINDNPDRKKLPEILNQFSLTDNRIKVIKNEKNQGLALSLNKLAKIATSELFVRMDADDISSQTRIEDQLREIEKGYDLIFSPYTYIDEESQPLNIKNDNLKIYTPYEIHKSLPINNIIHHPTVMMTRDIFKKAGGYRDFKVAQDYDLWLRIYDSGGKFKMTDKVLLKYRIRENSVSKQKKLQQKVTLDYTRRLFLERANTGKDSFSVESYKNYLNNNIAYENSITAELKYYNEILLRAKEAYYNKHYLRYFFLRLRVFIFSRPHRKHYFNILKDKIKLRSYIKKNLESNGFY